MESSKRLKKKKNRSRSNSLFGVAWEHRLGMALHVDGDCDGSTAVGPEDRRSRTLEGCECGWGRVTEEVMSADGDHGVARMYGGDERGG